ncbi:MAG: hypothetical protein R2991_02305 [Thermoanaerobaculia bacterium]
MTTGWYVSLIKDYLRRVLGYDSDVVFRASAGREVRPWSYHEDEPSQSYGTNAYANYAEHLREAMHENPALHVLVMSGYYDLATPSSPATTRSTTCNSTIPCAATSEPRTTTRDT